MNWYRGGEEMKRVIINGDDFGLSERCSLAIAQAMREGLITDTTMTANGAYFAQAAALAREAGFADRIGLHLNLTEGCPLTDGIKAIGDFVSGGRFVKRYAEHPRPLSEREEQAVCAELSAQARRLRDAGIPITHADSHHYIHNITFLAPTVARVCRENGILRIRLQRNLGDATGFEENNRFWRGEGFITAAFFGRMSDLMGGELPDRLEIMVHPDYDKNGVLIDRRRVESGFPAGEKLSRPSGEDVVLIGYRDL